MCLSVRDLALVRDCMRAWVRVCGCVSDLSNIFNTRLLGIFNSNFILTRLMADIHTYVTQTHQAKEIERLNGCFARL